MLIEAFFIFQMANFHYKYNHPMHVILKMYLNNYFLGLFLLLASVILLAANNEAVISFNILLAAVGLFGNKIKLLLESAPIDCKVS